MAELPSLVDPKFYVVVVHEREDAILEFETMEQLTSSLVALNEDNSVLSLRVFYGRLLKHSFHRETRVRLEGLTDSAPETGISVV